MSQQKPSGTAPKRHAQARRPYSPPRLIMHGTVANLTANLVQGGIGYPPQP